MSRLCEREDFRELVEVVAREIDVDPAIVEKDYYVTETLRIIAERFSKFVLFKGGTSLSKGWKLLDRFSEDIDLYVQDDSSSRRATDRRLKSIALAIDQHPFLSRDPTRARVSGGFGRTEYYAYRPHVAYLRGMDATVMLEAGIQSGDYPVEERRLQSLLAEALDQQGVLSGAEDQAPFQMNLLHFRRTFVEKLYTIHDRVERLAKRERISIGSYARHYYDLFRLLQTPEVRGMLRTPEFAEFAADYRLLTRRWYPAQALPSLMELSTSSALFPDATLRSHLADDYQTQCRRLCYGSFPAFEEVLGAFESIRCCLIPVPESD